MEENENRKLKWTHIKVNTIIKKSTRFEESRFYFASIKDYLYNAFSLMPYRWRWLIAPQD